MLAGYVTSAAAAELLGRAPKTVRNLVRKHGLDRSIVRVGRVRRRVMLLPPATVQRLRELCWINDSPAAVKKNLT